MSRIRLLINEDDKILRLVLRHRLTPLGYDCQFTSSSREGLRLLVRELPDIVITELDMIPVNGFEFIQRVADIRPSIPIIALCESDTQDVCAKAIQLGASKVLRKPIQFKLLDETIRKNYQGITTLSTKAVSSLVGNSAHMQNLRRILHRVSRTGRSTILILGESGTGKEVAAREIHKLSQCNGPFIPFNCALSDGGLIENALFGHERGAFTDAKTREKGLLEAAHDGVLFLDEIGEMHIETQSKLLRFLETGCFRKIGGHTEVSVATRVVAATHRDLPRMVRENRFREDLYFRLNVLPVTIHPLRERKEDLPLLVEHFIGKMADELHQPAPRVSSSVLTQLQDYDWPGNVRELKNLMERFVLLQEGLTIDIEDLPPEVTSLSSTSGNRLSAGENPMAEQNLVDYVGAHSDTKQLFERPLPEARRRFETMYLQRLLTRYEGNVASVARASGLDPSNLRRTLKRHHLDPVTFRPTK